MAMMIFTFLRIFNQEPHPVTTGFWLTCHLRTCHRVTNKREKHENRLAVGLFCNTENKFPCKGDSAQREEGKNEKLFKRKEIVPPK
jgi:hypothetical protein